MSNYYGKIFQLGGISTGTYINHLPRLLLKADKGAAKYNEAWLQNLIANQPEVLPIEEIEPVFADAVPVCTEMPTGKGFVDVLLVTPLGDLVVVECKLWRNPEARRAVVGQILEYAKDIARMSYQELEKAVLKARPAPGTAKEHALFIRASGEQPKLEESVFIDAVSRNLRRGRFLLLLVGDGIREDIEMMTEFLQQHAGIHFAFGLVEIAIYEGKGDAMFVQPRILAKTIMIKREVVVFIDGEISIGANDQSTLTTKKKIVPTTLSEERVFELFDQTCPGMAAKLQDFLENLESLDVTWHVTPQYLYLDYKHGGVTVTLGYIGLFSGRIGLADTVSQSVRRGYRELAMSYYRTLVSLVTDPSLRFKKLASILKGVAAEFPVTDLLNEPDAWRKAIADFIAALPEDVGATAQ